MASWYVQVFRERPFELDLRNLSVPFILLLHYFLSLPILSMRIASVSGNLVAHVCMAHRVLAASDSVGKKAVKPFPCSRQNLDH